MRRESQQPQNKINWLGNKNKFGGSEKGKKREKKIERAELLTYLLTYKMEIVN